MTRREIESAKASLPSRTQIPFSEWTDEQKQLDRELSCREMINSILCYDGEDGLLNNEYLEKYIPELGLSIVQRLCDEQLVDFKKATVVKNVFTDNEGVSYNSIKWADELSLEDKLAEAKGRSEQQSEVSENCKIDILQLKPGNKTRNIRFLSTSLLKNGVDDVVYANYNHTYSYMGDKKVSLVNDDEIYPFLEEVYMKFNSHRPYDFMGHSLSVSDIVVVASGELTKAFYCNSFGFEELPERFLEEYKKDVAQIDRGNDSLQLDL